MIILMASETVCGKEHDEVRHDVMTGEFYDTGFTLVCANPVTEADRDDEGRCICRECRELEGT